MRGALKLEAKTLPGFHPGDCDFLSQPKCTFKSHMLLVFSDLSCFLPSFRLPLPPRGIQPLSPQYWAVCVNISTFHLLHHPRGRFMRVVSVRVFLRSNAVLHFTSPGMGQMSGQIPHSQSPYTYPLKWFSTGSVTYLLSTLSGFTLSIHNYVVKHSMISRAT